MNVFDKIQVEELPLIQAKEDEAEIVALGEASHLVVSCAVPPSQVDDGLPF